MSLLLSVIYTWISRKECSECLAFTASFLHKNLIWGHRNYFHLGISEFLMWIIIPYENVAPFKINFNYRREIEMHIELPKWKNGLRKMKGKDHFIMLVLLHFLLERTSSEFYVTEWMVACIHCIHISYRSYFFWRNN